MPKHFIRSLALLVALLLAGCSSDSTGPEKGRTFGGGSVTFSYSGVKTGSMEASGELVLDAIGNAQVGSYALGITDMKARQPGQLMIQGHQAIPGTRGNELMLMFSAGRVGVYNVGLNCVEDASTRCALGIVILDGHNRDGTESSTNTYSLEAGQVQITSLTRTDAEGTFMGTAFPTVPGTDELTSAPLQITNGKFRVKLADLRELANARAYPRGSASARTRQAAWQR